MPAAVFNRAADNWCPLVAIADAAGGDWPKKARDAALGREAAAEAESTSAMLLSDLRDMFTALETNGDLFGTAYDSTVPRPFGSERPASQKETDRARSEHIAGYLNSLTARPWPTWNRGRGINPSNLAKLLKAYGIKVTHPRIGTLQLNGYRADQFNDAFLRYLQPEGSPGSPRAIIS
jgi:putative DNA primase/helicase